MSILTEWVTGVYWKKCNGKEGSQYFLIIACTDQGERRKIYVDERFETDIVHFLWAIKREEKHKIPIIPKKGIQNAWHVDLSKVDAPVPSKQSFASPNHRMLVDQLSFDANRSSPLTEPRVRQSFRLNNDYVKKAESLASKKQIAKTDLYAKAVSHYLELESRAEQIGI